MKKTKLNLHDKKKINEQLTVILYQSKKTYKLVICQK